MNLQFYFGAAGSGKSHKLNHDLIKWAIENPDKRFFIIVPDQFTMHTQMELVKAHPKRGILNIEVLSFSRLSHRIFEEVGAGNRTILDDTGKSLVLRKVAADIAAELPIIGKSLNKLGYIAEVKSTISEFMQYTITPTELKKMIDFTIHKKALSAKLKDIHCLYEAFLIYIQNKYITTEETLSLLSSSLHKSEIIRGSVFVFDGFTGFTPIQNLVIRKLMALTEKVIISVLIGKEEIPVNLSEINEQSLFYLTRKMTADLCKIAGEAKINRLRDEYLDDEIPRRFIDKKKFNINTELTAAEINQEIPAANYELAHLEKNIFRYPIKAYHNSSDSNPKSTGSINITESPSIAAEVRQALIKIKELTMDHAYSYREISIIAADMNEYALYLEREASKYEIPIYLDHTKGILLNPFTEFIRSALKIINKNYSYDAVFHFLRSGFTDLTHDEVDRLENYVIGCGIKGRKMYHEKFFRRLRGWRDDELSERLIKLNQSREKMLAALKPLDHKFKNTGDIVKALYNFNIAGRSQQKLKIYEETFIDKKDLIKAKEYSQIYRLVMELLDQIYSLLKDEPMSLKEFAEIFDAGLSEIKVGTIPQNIDRVVIGDMERTRLSRVRALFFLGINDGNIPAGLSRGGLISDLDREFLKKSAWELSPTPRQKMYIQRLYLYMNMTKPSEKLYLSYARVNSEGKSLRPSYLIDTVRKLFPEIVIERYNDDIKPAHIFGLADSLDAFVTNLRKYALLSHGKNINNTRYHGETDTITLTLLANVYQLNDDYKNKADRLITQAFDQYSHRPLTKEAADLLYGNLINNSISRLEKFAACAYAHFLQYGLALREREEHSFEAVDLGNVYHGVLEIFAGKLAEHKLTWLDFSDEIGDALLREAVLSYAAQYGETVLFGSARNIEMVERIYRIMLRTVRTIRRQLRQGDFLPERFEANFSQAEGLRAVSLELSPKEVMSLRGQIDRIDICEAGEQVLVKVIDYKSGHKRFDPAALYQGLQLQLMVYLNVALEMTKQDYPDKEVVPAAVLYYHVSDPMINEEAELSREEIEMRLLAELKMTGIINEDEEIIKRLDRDFESKSWVIPVSRKKDGSFSSNSGVVKLEEFGVMSRYVNEKIISMGREIKSGEIAMKPFEYGGDKACTYCEFKGVCGFDIRLPGYRMRKLKKLSRDEAIELMTNDKLNDGSRLQ